MKPKQAIKICVNAAMTLVLLFLMVSGVILSSKVFAFLQIRGRMAFARRLHMAASYWGFLLMAAHRRPDGKPSASTPLLRKRPHVRAAAAVGSARLPVSRRTYDRAEISQWLENAAH